MNKWTKHKLGDLTLLNYGKSLVADKRTKGDIPVYSSSGISGWHDEALVESEAIIVGRKGNVGSVFYADKPFYCIDTAYYILPSDKYDLKFLYYKLQSMNLIKLTSDSAVPGLNRETAYAQEIDIPESLDLQIELASILSSLDDKIELNLQINQTLETMAQAIFKEWFVNFSFPGFNGKLVDGLPRGWDYKMIKEIGKVITGNTPSSNNPEFFGETTPFITPTDFKNFGKLIIDADRHLSNEGRLAMTSRLLPKDSVIVTCIGSDMGKVAINKVECVTNQQINSIIPNEKIISADYLYYDLGFKYDYLRNIATGGSTMPIINKSRFEQIEIVVPNYEVVRQFQLLMNELNSKNEENIRQIKVLTQIRDSLLPKLMTGQIEVKA